MFIRYDQATRREIVRSTVPFTIKPEPGQADAELQDAALPPAFGICRLTEDMTGLEVDPALVPAPTPDGPAFIKAVQLDAFGNDLDRIDAVWNLCPLWWPAAKEENWTLVEAYTIRALQRGHITQTEYNGIKTAATTYHIPVTL